MEVVQYWITSFDISKVMIGIFSMLINEFTKWRCPGKESQQNFHNIFVRFPIHFQHKHSTT